MYLNDKTFETDELAEIDLPKIYTHIKESNEEETNLQINYFYEEEKSYYKNNLTDKPLAKGTKPEYLRVQNIADYFRIDFREVIEKAEKLDIRLKYAQNTLSIPDAKRIFEYIKEEKVLESKKTQDNTTITKINNNDNVTVAEIADEAGSEVSEVIKKADELDIKLISAHSTIPNEIAEEIINYMMSGQKHTLDKEVIDTINSIEIEIHNLKKIKSLKFHMEYKKGIYAIAGNNGVGKSSLITCLGKLVQRGALKDEFIANQSYKNSKIIYRIAGYEIIWEKPNNWEATKKNTEDMPKLNGLFEASIISGHRFEHIQHKKIQITEKEAKDSVEADKFVIETLDYIINGENTGFFKELHVIKNKTYKELYFLKKDDDYLTEFFFSAGEYFLLSILKFIIKFKKRKNLHDIGFIIIDEVEISLHPLAQKRLLEVFTKLFEELNLLIIFATHSLQIIENIHPNNLYYFENYDGICSISNPIYPAYLTSRLYRHTFFDKIILVEDDLAKKFIEHIIKEKNIKGVLYQIIPIGGWEKVIEIYNLNETKNIYSNADVVVVLDGDTNDKTKAKKRKYDSVRKRFLPIKSVENYFVHELYHDIDFRHKIEDYYIQPKKISELDVTIKSENTDDIKNTYSKFLTETEKYSNYDESIIELEIIKHIILKLKKNEKDKIDRFYKFISDYFITN